jgi:hypothetical protein
VSASATGELAQPGGDRLFVAPRLAPASRACLACGHGVRTRERRRDLAGSGARDEPPRSLGVVNRAHRWATLASLDGQNKN